MKKILILISIMFLAGCVSTFNVEKANTYLQSHPDRPDHIKKAISVGEVVQGMNEEEVTIYMGKPDVITNSQNYQFNTNSTTWAYFNRAKLKRTFILFKNGAVIGINTSTQKGILMAYPVGTISPVPVIKKNCSK